MSKVHLKVSMVYLGCWIFYTVRASCSLLKKKSHWRLLTTKHSLSVMNYFTPLEGFTWLILYETYFLLLYSHSRCFLSHRIHWWLNSLHSSSFLNTPTPTHPRRCQHCLWGVGNNTLPLLVNLHQIQPGLGSSVRSFPPLPPPVPPSFFLNLNYSF